MAKRRRNRPGLPRISGAEREQVRLRKEVDHDFALRKDEHGRDRLIVGTAESGRAYERDEKSTVVRVQRADHLQTMFKQGAITKQQHQAGEMYQEDYVLVHSYGLGSGGWTEKVDISGIKQPDMPLHVTAANQRLELCSVKAGMMGEYVLRQVCGENNSPSSLKGIGGAPREYWTARLREALEEIAVHVYRTMRDRDRTMVVEDGPVIPPAKQT